jgi:hypothetical protein
MATDGAAVAELRALLEAARVEGREDLDDAGLEAVLEVVGGDAEAARDFIVEQQPAGVDAGHLSESGGSDGEEGVAFAAAPESTGPSVALDKNPRDPEDSDWRWRATLAEHSDWTLGVAFIPSPSASATSVEDLGEVGRLAVSASIDEHLCLWDVAAGKLIAKQKVGIFWEDVLRPFRVPLTSLFFPLALFLIYFGVVIGPRRLDQERSCLPRRPPRRHCGR